MENSILDSRTGILMKSELAFLKEAEKSQQICRAHNVNHAEMRNERVVSKNILHENTNIFGSKHSRLYWSESQQCSILLPGKAIVEPNYIEKNL